MKKNLHLLKVIKNAFGRVNKSKVFGLFLISLSVPVFAQIQKLDDRFQHLVNKKETDPSARKLKIEIQSPSKIEAKTVVTKDGVHTMYSAIVYTNNPEELKNKGVIVESIYNNFATVLLTAEGIQKLYDDDSIISIQAPNEDNLANSVSLNQSGADLLHKGLVNNTVYDGTGVLVGIYDTGIDWAHPDFRDPNDPTKSRIVSIWDQTLTAIGTETPPSRFTTGVEYTRAHIEDEIDGTPTGFVRQKDINGHGTHVAGTVAGNGSASPDKRHKGFAPNAEIVIVKGGNNSFPTDNTIKSLTYFQNVATALNKPIVVNYSIGGQGTHKDGLESHEIAMDNFASAPGRVVVVAAGNDGAQPAHKKIELEPIKIDAYDDSKDSGDFTIRVKSITGTTAGTLATYNFLINSDSIVGVTVKGPDGKEVEYDFNINHTLAASFLDNSYRAVVQSLVLAQNNKRRVIFQLQRIENPTITDAAGDYTISFKNKSNKSIAIDGYRMTSIGISNIVGADNHYMVSSPGNSTEAITVANYNGRERWFSSYNGGNYSVPTSTQGFEGIVDSSNEGPRLDGVLKPEIAASGSMVVSSRSADAPIIDDDLPLIADNAQYRAMNGTSMASPGVAGATALLLQAKPNLTAKEVKELLTTSAFKDIATGTTANAKWGHGKLNIYEAVSKTLLPIKSDFETLSIDDKLIATRYYSEVTNLTIGNILTPTKSGKLGSVSIMTRHNASQQTIADSPLILEVRKFVNGQLAEVLGTKTINSPVAEMQLGSWHSFDISDLNIQTTYGEKIAVILKTSGKFYILVDLDKPSGNSFIINSSNQLVKQSNSDFIIRATVYEDVSPVKVLATANRETSLAIANNKNYFVKDWENIGRIEKNEGHTIEGEVKAKVWLTNSTEHVNRVYEYTPVNNAESASAKVTLYYTQADFDQFNENKTKKLPTSPTDDAGKSNLVLYKYSGTSSDNSGARSSYTQGFTTIPLTASNILWNPTYSFWEVSFETTGFSGFIMGTDESLSTANSKANGLQVYPNPVKEQLNINLPQGESKGQATFYDMTGRAVKTVSLNSTNDLNVSSLAKGVYLVEITTSKGVKETKKIVKQ